MLIEGTKIGIKQSMGNAMLMINFNFFFLMINSAVSSVPYNISIVLWRIGSTANGYTVINFKKKKKLTKKLMNYSKKESPLKKSRTEFYLTIKSLASLPEIAKHPKTPTVP